MKTIVLLLLCLTAQQSKAQFLEKVYLKDSVTVHAGWIVEQIPQQYLRMLRQQQRDTLYIPVDSIWKIVRVLDARFLRPAPQVRNRHKAVYLEGGGPSIYHAINGEIRLQRKRRDGWGIRAGIGRSSVYAYDTALNRSGMIRLTTVPLMLNYLAGTRRSAFETGIGMTLLFTKLKFLPNSMEQNVDAGSLLYRPRTGLIGYFTAYAGYRYTPLRSGVTFRAGAAALWSGGYGISIQPGLSIGYAF